MQRMQYKHISETIIFSHTTSRRIHEQKKMTSQVEEVEKEAIIFKISLYLGNGPKNKKESFQMSSLSRLRQCVVLGDKNLSKQSDKNVH